MHTHTTPTPDTADRLTKIGELLSEAVTLASGDSPVLSPPELDCVCCVLDRARRKAVAMRRHADLLPAA